jgi:hypothetical protein
VAAYFLLPWNAFRLRLILPGVIWLKNHPTIARLIGAPFLLAIIAGIGYAWWDMLTHKQWLLIPVAFFTYRAMKGRGFKKRPG